MNAFSTGSAAGHFRSGCRNSQTLSFGGSFSATAVDPVPDAVPPRSCDIVPPVVYWALRDRGDQDWALQGDRAQSVRLAQSRHGPKKGYKSFMTKRFGLRFAAVRYLSGLVLTALAVCPTGAGRVWLPSGAAIEGQDFVIPLYAYLIASLIWIVVLHRFAVHDPKRKPRLVDELQRFVPATFFSTPILAGTLNSSYIHKSSQ